MTVRVMLVDDSATVRALMMNALTVNPEIQVVTVAVNGAVAIPIARQYQPDIILLDIEMPEMDGITALPRILEAAPHAKIIMVSTLTLRNAAISLKALELGATDYITKPTARAPEELEHFYRDLREKIQALAGAGKWHSTSGSEAIALISPQTPLPPVKALAIASSTGGPQALLKLLPASKTHCIICRYS